MIGWMIVAGTVLALAVLVFVLVRQGHPEDAASHYPPVHPKDTRPAGPDAETQDPDELGSNQPPPDT